MKEQILTLETDDDLHSLRDKILRAQAGRILLLWRALAEPIDRRLDAVLLEYWAAGIGASLAVVSPDSAVRRLCRQAGIEAYPDLTAASTAPAPGARKDHAIPQRGPRRFIGPLPRQPSRKIHPAGRLAIFSTAVLSIVLVGLLLIPSAAVKAQFPGRRIHANAPFPQSDCASIQSDLQTEGRATTTGRVLANTAYAEGTVDLTNTSGQSLTIPAGLYVATQDGIRFRTASGLTLKSGGTASVPIRAIQPGTDGNVRAGAIETVEGSLGMLLEAQNPAATTGGAAEWRNGVTQADVDGLQQSLKTHLENEAPERIAALVGDGNSLVAGSTATDFGPEAQPDYAVQSASDTVGLRLSATVSALVCPTGQMSKRAMTMLSAILKPGETLYRESIEFQMQMESGGILILSADGQAFSPPDPQSVLFTVRGRTPDQAADSLRSRFGAGGKISIAKTPDWIPWLPIFPFQIRFLPEPDGSAG